MKKMLFCIFLPILVIGCFSNKNLIENKNMIEYDVSEMVFTYSGQVIACDFIKYPNCFDPIYKRIVFSDDKSDSSYLRPKVFIEDKKNIIFTYCDGKFYIKLSIDKNDSVKFSERSFHISYNNDMIQFISFETNEEENLTFYGSVKDSADFQKLGTKINPGWIFEGPRIGYKNVSCE